jgi:hypothetical protein
MRKKAQTLSAFTNSSETIARRKLELIELHATLTSNVKSLRVGIESQLASATDLFDRQTKPTRLLIKIDDGRVLATHVA